MRNRCAFGLLVFALVYIVWRAIVLPIGPDEWMFFAFSHHGWQLAWTDDFGTQLPNLVLALLCKSVSNSRFAIRLPALFFGICYLGGVWRLTAGVQGWWRVVAILALLNPFALEYFSMSRGYAGGLACVVWAMVWAMRNSSSAGAPLFAAGAVACQVSFLPFCGAVLLWHTWVNRFSLVQVRRLVIPVCLVVLVMLNAMRRQQFEAFYGHSESLFSKAVLSICDCGTRRHCGDVLAVLMIFVAGLLAERRNVGAWFLLGSYGVIIALHLVRGVNYPYDRYLLYVIPCLAFMAMLTAHRVGQVLLVGMAGFTLATANLSQRTMTPADVSVPAVVQQIAEETDYRVVLGISDDLKWQLWAAVEQQYKLPAADRYQDHGCGGELAGWVWYELHCGGEQIRLLRETTDFFISPADAVVLQSILRDYQLAGCFAGGWTWWHRP